MATKANLNTSQKDKKINACDATFHSKTFYRRDSRVRKRSWPPPDSEYRDTSDGLNALKYYYIRQRSSQHL